MDRYAFALSVISTLLVAGVFGTMARSVWRAVKTRAVGAHSSHTNKPAESEGWTTNTVAPKRPRSLARSLQKPSLSVAKKHPRLTDSQVIRILEMCAAGERNRDIAAAVACTGTHVSRIRNVTAGSAKVRELVNAWISRHPEADLHRRGDAAEKRRRGR